jgi:hypothetical protein
LAFPIGLLLLLVAALADRGSKPSSSTKVKPGGRMLQREIGHITALRLYVSVTGGPGQKGVRSAD